MLTHLLRSAKSLKSDRRGVSAIEFAIIFPLLIVLLAGVTDLGQALIVHRKVNQIVATTSDIVSQQSSWTGTNLDANLAATAHIIVPFETAGLTLTVSIINVDNSNNATVAWSRSFQGTALSPGDASPMDIPSNIVESGVQLVVAEATYSLSTPFASLLAPVMGSTSYEFDRFSISRPRTQSTVTLN